MAKKARRQPKPKPRREVRAGETVARRKAAGFPVIQFHPFADAFPLIAGDELEEFHTDLKQNGVRDTLDLYEGKLLDGRNRYLGARAVKLPFAALKFRTFKGARGQALDYVISKNLRRRHLNDDQRRMAAARIVTLGRGRPGNKPANGGISVADAAKRLKVDEAGTERARKVVTRGTPELQKAVDSGAASVRAAAEIASLPLAEQKRTIAAIAASPDARAAFKAVVKELRADTQEKKQARRADRARELGARQRALPEKKFGVIYADPPWRFEPFSRETGMDRAADNHYPTMTLVEIMALPVEPLAAPDCALFLWATAPMLPAALEAMRHWGFDYKAHGIWKKDRIGTGYWFRNSHELLLVGTRGKIPAPAMGQQWPSVMDAPVGEHSAKPEKFFEVIEDYFADLPKVVLFHRGPAREGWEVWGNEAVASARPEPDGEAAATSLRDDLEIPNFLKRKAEAPPAGVTA